VGVRGRIGEVESLRPIQFINEAIEVRFDRPPALEKKPGAPSGFRWKGDEYEIAEVISEWHDYRRRGRIARNMATEHAARAERGGSGGVGRDYYRVKTVKGRFFEIYMTGRRKTLNGEKGAGISIARWGRGRKQWGFE